MRTLQTLVFAALGFVGSAACSGDTGQLSVGITTDIHAVVTDRAEPAPPDQLLLTVSSVEVHVVAADGKAEPDGAWITVLDAPSTIDLLQPAATRAFLASADVPAGRITQIRLVLDGDVAFVHGGASTVIRCPSCTESGLKVVTRGALVLAAGATLEVTLDVTATFDVDRARLDPVIVLASLR